MEPKTQEAPMTDDSFCFGAEGLNMIIRADDH